MQSALREQLRTGSATALVIGSLLGLLLGIGLIRMEHASLILPTAASRWIAVIFLASCTALLSVLLMLPVEVIAASVFRAASARFYTAVLVGGFGFVFCALLFRFRLFRNPSSPESLAAHTGIALIALCLIVLAYRSGRNIPAKSNSSGWILMIATLALAGAAFFCFARLSAQPEFHGNTPPSHSAASAVPASGNSPNIVMVSIDTLRADHVGAYGYSRATTPHIDRLARQGILFRNAVTPAPWTLPAHASLLTGLYPSSHGARFSSQHAPVLDKLDSRIDTAAEILSSAGYDTAAFTSVFWLSNEWSTLQGFQTADSSTAKTADAVVTDALQWLTKRQSKPFFLFLHFFDAHEFTSPPEFDGRFQDPKYAGVLKQAPLLTSRNAYSNLNDSDMHYLVAKYDGALAFVDQQLERVFQQLESSGNWNNTIVLVTSDHGEEFLDHGGTGHGFTLYREALHVPLILKLPGVSPMEISDPVSLVDVAPTVLDFVGIRRAGGDGISLRPAIEKGRLPGRLLIAEDTYFMNSSAVMEGDFKFIDNRIPPPDLLNGRMLLVNLRSFFKFSAPELYNVRSDPTERSNTVAQDRDRARLMQSQLAAHVKIRNVGEQEELEEDAREKMKSVGYVQ